VSVATANTAWVGRAHVGRPTGARGTVAAVRGRRTHRERRLARQIGIGALLALAIALLLVWVRLQILRTGYDLSAAHQLERNLTREQRELGLAIATLTSPRRLEEAARTRLGMGPPVRGQIVSVP
jgi:cell division protein FtsL